MSSGLAWTFPGMQLLVFAVALGAAYDWAPLKAAGANPRDDLQTVYRLEDTRLLTVAIPVALAVLAIAQQVRGGSGFDFIQGVIEHTSGLVPNP